MSAAEKVALVEGARSEFGLSACLRILGLARSTWYYQARRQPYGEKHRRLQGPVEEIARKHPEYGYRRTTTELREAYDEHVNHKVVQRLHRLWGLPLVRSTRHPAPSKVRQVLIEVEPRANLVAQLSTEIGPFNVAYTDFTELVYATGKAHLIPILDHTTKLVLEWKLGPRALTALALAAWEMAKATLQELGRTPAG